MITGVISQFEFLFIKLAATSLQLHEYASIAWLTVAEPNIGMCRPEPDLTRRPGFINIIYA